jgi:hypothetical protein
VIPSALAVLRFSTSSTLGKLLRDEDGEQDSQ